MYHFAQLQQEIQEKIHALIGASSGTLHPDWITQAVMDDHLDVTGEDADFHLVCSRVTVRKEVTQQINRIEPKDSPGERSPQLSLDGFAHMQQYYVCKRRKDLVGVRVDLMGNDELREKAAEYRAMGMTCMAHAEEIERYIRLRADRGDTDDAA